MNESDMKTEEYLQKAEKPARDALELHPYYRGKIETGIKCAVRDMDDFSVWYSPGVAAPCREIESDPAKVYEHTSKWNTVAVISDGSRVLGLGDIGPKAGLPVMEGKALLFKYLGGVDAVPLMLDVHEPEKIIEMVMALQPSFGGVNLEDIASPKCYQILDTLRETAEIPVWHDDQQGTATVTLAGIINALKVVGKDIADARIVFVGSGASNVTCARLIFGWGADPEKCRVVDSKGIMGTHRSDIEAARERYAKKWELCRITNGAGIEGGVETALKDADAVVALSRPGPGTIEPEWVRQMADDAIVFACANPVPEIWPWEAKQAGAAIVATGRSDFPNQVNNSVGFPGIFRGALDVRAGTISDEMCFAAAAALADYMGDELDAEHILPTMEEPEVFAQEAAAVGMKAIEQGLAALNPSREDLLASARSLIARSQDVTRSMMRNGFVSLP